MIGRPVYRIYDGDTGELLYIGTSVNPHRRLRTHELTQPWWPTNPRITVEFFRTGAESNRAEWAAIEAENPRYNIARYPTPPGPRETWAKDLDAIRARYYRLREAS